MRTRLTWLLIGAALAVFATQAWARTLSTSTAQSKARSYAYNSVGGTISRTVEFIDRPRVYPQRCARGLTAGDPPDPPGGPVVQGSSVHRFDCAADVRRDGQWDSPYGGTVGRPPTTHKRVYMVVTMKHHRDIFQQPSYPVSVRRANCNVERCITPN